jgi:uncharacterized protein
MELTREQRWILANQYRILELLDPESADHYALARTVLERGYESEYDSYAEHIYQETMSPSESQEVTQILDMFSALERCYRDMSPQPNVKDWQVRFSGFDGNHETTQLGYAHHLIDREGRWRELADHGDKLNSHAPSLGAYRRMLTVWEKLPTERKYQLTREDIENITAERIHPENR